MMNLKLGNMSKAEVRVSPPLWKEAMDACPENVIFCYYILLCREIYFHREESHICPLAESHCTVFSFLFTNFT